MVIGRLGKDPELKSLSNETSVCNFSVAVSKKWKKKDGTQEEKTTWIGMSAWGKTAEVISKYLAKGSQAYFEGELETSSWEKNGEKRYKTEVRVERIEFLEKAVKKEESQEDSGW